MTERQRTLAGEIKVAGVGIHSGETVELRIAPAPEGTGIVFRRTDVEGAWDVPARLPNVTRSELATELGGTVAGVRTVEHLMAAFAAMRVDNAVVRLNGPEVPILDGSFAPWVRMLRDAGFASQRASAAFVAVTEPISVRRPGGGSYVARPCSGLRVSATIDFEHPVIGRQHGDFRLDPHGFETDVAAARTFGFAAHADALRSRGFARGASLANAVVLSPRGVLNGDLRYPDEFLRHKVGDLLGDLALIGRRLRCHVIADRPSHGGNVALARAILASHLRRQPVPRTHYPEEPHVQTIA